MASGNEEPMRSNLRFALGFWGLGANFRYSEISFATYVKITLPNHLDGFRAVDSTWGDARSPSYDRPLRRIPDRRHHRQWRRRLRRHRQTLRWHRRLLVRLELLPAGRKQGREDVVNGWPGHYKNGTKLPTPTAAKEMSKKKTPLR